MDWGKVLDIIKKIIPEIKAKVQVAEKLSFNITIFKKVVNVNLPPGTDLDKVVSIPPDRYPQIEDRALSELKKNEDQLDSMPEDERLQKITDVTSEAIIYADIHETMVVSDFIDAELEKKDP